MAIMIDSEGNGTDGSKWVPEERLLSEVLLRQRDVEQREQALRLELKRRALSDACADTQHAAMLDELNEAREDVMCCHELVSAARRLVQYWRDRSVNTGPLAPLLERLEKAVGL